MSRRFRPHQMFPRLSFDTLECRTMPAGLFGQLADSLAAPIAALSNQLDAASPNHSVPVLGSFLGRAGDFLGKTSGLLQDVLGDLADVTEEEAEQAIFDALGNSLGDRNDDGTVTPADVEVELTDTKADLRLSLLQESQVSGGDLFFNLGLPALPFSFRNLIGGFEVSYGFEVNNLHFGVDNGVASFDFEPSGKPDLIVSADAGLSDDFKLEGAIGFVHGSVKANPNPDEVTGVSAKLTVDLDQQGVADVQVTGTAGINLLLTGEPLGPKFPGISAGLHVSWEQLTDTPVVEIRDVGVEFKSNFLAPIVEHLEPIFNAAGKVVSILDKDIPVLSDLTEALGHGPVSALDILNLAEKANALPANYDAILKGVLAIVDVVQLLDTLEADNGKTLKLNFGNFQVDGLSTDKLAGSITDLEGNLSELIVNGNPTGLDLAGIQAKVNDSELPDGVKEGLNNLLGQLQNGFSLSFPLFENPKAAIFPLFLGQDTDLFRLDAHLNTTENYGESFSLPLGFDAGFSGGLKPDLDLTFGYDTKGLRTYLRNLFDEVPTPAEKSDLLNGFYFSKDTGFRLEATIEAGVGLNAVLFHADVKGGVSGFIEIAVSDDQAGDDGKVRLRDGELGAHANLFSVDGGINAYLTASVGVGVDLPFGNFVGIEKKWELASRDLVKFNFDRIANPWYVTPPLVPALAIRDEETGVVTLNIGEGNKRAYMPEVTDEVYSIVSVPAEDTETGHVIAITFNGQTERFDNVTSIIGNAGNGKDYISIVLDPTWSDVPIDITGGSSDDIIEVESGGTVTLGGDSGNDSLSVTGAKNVVLEGGDNDDQLTYIGTGTATISGNNGHDTLWGGDGTNKLYGGHGNDALYGGKGANFLYGDGGHDTLSGGSGTNEQYGGTGNDHLTAGPNGDHLEGGSNDDVFVTGTGNDLVIVAETNDPASFEQISWQYGNGNTVIEAQNLHNVKLEVLGSDADDTFLVRNGGVGQLVIEAPNDDRTITGSGLDRIHIDGRHGADHIVITPLAPGHDIDDIGVNLSDNLDDDHEVDLIEVFGSLGADALTVDHLQVVLKEYEPGNEPGVDAHGGLVDPPKPEQLVWGGVMSVTGMPNYTVYAMNVADDLRVLTQGGNDTVTVNGITGPTRIDTGIGNDTINVLAATKGQPGVVTNKGLILPDFATELQIEAGTGVNAIMVSEQDNANGDTIIVNETKVHSGILPGVNWQATGGQIGTVLVIGTNHQDEFQVLATSPATNLTTVQGWKGNDTFVVGKNATLASIGGPLNIAVGAGNSTAVLNDRNAVAGNANVLFNNNSVSGLAGPTDNKTIGFAAAVGGSLLVSVDASNSATQEQFTLNNFQHGVRIEGNLGNDKFVVGVLPRAAELRGGTGIDRYTIGSLDKLAATLTINDSVGLNQIFVDDTTAVVGRNYELNANALNVFGNAHDEIVLTGATGTLDVQATNFNDQFRAAGSPPLLQVTTNLRAGTNTLVGPDTATTWTLNALNDVTVGTAGRYTNAQNLVGGAANDRFVFTPPGRIGGTLFAAGGTDTLDYSAWVNGVSVDLQSGVVSGVTGLATHVENVTGGSGNDVLQGNANPNLLDGGAGNDIILGRAGADQLFGGNGRDLLIGGLGADVLQGGGDDDILIGGTTTHDNNLAVLNAIHGVWVGNQTYVTRVTNLRAGLLTMATVINDLEPDSLLGQSGLDWFWWFPNDTADRVAGELDR